MNIEVKATYNEGVLQLDEPLILTDGQEYTIIIKDIKDAVRVRATNGNGSDKHNAELAALQKLAESHENDAGLVHSDSEAKNGTFLKFAPKGDLETGEITNGKVYELLMEIAGTYDGPEDWSEEHDHYLYGTPKRFQKNKINEETK
jgi:predicted DNA-binding antitoxin AbrB/MazE fold protein